MPPQQLFHQSDKAAHLLAFAGLAFTGRFALINLPGIIYWPSMMFIALSAEYLQGIVQVSRFSSIEDGVANIAGIVFALLMFIFCKKWNNTKVAA